MTHYRPEGVQFTIERNTPDGKTITVPRDISTYYLEREQRFIPHEVEDDFHPAHIGQMVTFRNPLFPSPYGVCYPCVGFVSGVRTFRAQSKRSSSSRQIELAGLPGRWFTIAHFEEYENGLRYGPAGRLKRTE